MPGLTPLGVLFVVLLLEGKHFLGDGPLQTRWMLGGKADYGDIRGIVHALVHGALTCIVLAGVGTGFGLAAVLGLADAAIHYHVDYGKASINRAKRWTIEDARYWWLYGADQTLHHFTYLGLVAVLVRTGGSL